MIPWEYIISGLLLSQIVLLFDILFKLGRVTARLEDHHRRLARLEEKKT